MEGDNNTARGSGGRERQTEQIYAQLYKLTLGLEAVQAKLNALNRALDARVFPQTQTEDEEGRTHTE